MRVAVFSTKPYDREFLERANIDHGHDLVYIESRLQRETTPIAEGFPAVCPFVNDDLSAIVLDDLHDRGVRLLALRSAGFNHVDIERAEELGFTVVRVPAYSPHAVAEHTVALILALNRKIHRSYARVRDANFSINGLLGFDLRGRTVGVVGTGAIGRVVARIMSGFDCRVVAFDPHPDPDVAADYLDLDVLFADSDIVTLHCPLTPDTHHLVDAEAIDAMRDGVMLINTSRGALVDTAATIEALKSGKIGYLGLDVYEEEEHLFFQDLSDRVIRDDVFMRLLTFPNVLVTAHQAFFTQEALERISRTTLENITRFDRGEKAANVVVEPGG